MTKAKPLFSDLGPFIQAAAGCEWSAEGDLFLLLDGARLADMSSWLQRRSTGAEWISLLGATVGTSLLEVSPVLVRLPAQSSDNFLRRLLNNPTALRAASVLISQYSLRQLADHLIRHLYVEDPDGTCWGLAFWDPFILSSLVGARPPASALVSGPVLTPVQCASLLAPVAWWCFRGRDGNPCAIRPPAATDDTADLPFSLNQLQIDQLADIPLPDQVFNVLTVATPEIASSCSGSALHQVCCNAILQSRAIGCDDLAAYCAAASDALMQIAPSRNGSPSPTKLR